MTPHPASNEFATFEERLAHDSRQAMSEGSLFFEGKGAVQESLERIARRLNELGVPYAVAGGMALFQYGYRRFTEDVGILVTREGLRQIHQALEGRGYIRPFERSKNLRDADSRVKIEFLLAGDFPGDGKPKAVQFPDPAGASIERDGIKFLKLDALVELKLASGMTGADRLKDLSDVQELIKLLNLPQDFARRLSESVRGRYEELWRNAHQRPKRFIASVKLPQDAPFGHVATLDDLIHTARQGRQTGEAMDAEVERWEAMLRDGVQLEARARTPDQWLLTTSDPEIARRYGLEDESEFFDEP